jgi:hypothetical protein
MCSLPGALFLPTYGIVTAVPACNKLLAPGRKPLRTAAAYKFPFLHFDAK